MSSVGVIYRFRVAPEDDEKAEAIMRDIFDAMAIEEYPTGDVKTYILYRDPQVLGQWYMFEHFTAKGSANHATGPLIYKSGTALRALQIEPDERILLDPVIVHGCGERIPGALPAAPSDEPEVGVIYKFRVAPEDDEKAERIMRDIFDAMAIEEYPTGDVKTYTLYRDPQVRGQWYMFEHFTAKGSTNHATGPLIYKSGTALQALQIEPDERILLDPVIVHGCGEPISGLPGV